MKAMRLDDVAADFEKLPIKPEARPLILQDNATNLLKLKWVK